MMRGRGRGIQESENFCARRVKVIGPVKRTLATANDQRSFSLALPVREQALLHFAECGAGKALNSNEGTRDFEGGKVPPATLFQVCRIEWLPRYDVSHRHFAPNRIGLTGYCSFRHLFLLHEKIFNLAWIDVEAAGDDQVTLPDK